MYLHRRRQLSYKSEQIRMTGLLDLLIGNSINLYTLLFSFLFYIFIILNSFYIPLHSNFPLPYILSQCS